MRALSQSAVDAAPARLDLGALGLALQTALLRAVGRPRRSPGLGGLGDRVDQFLQAPQVDVSALFGDQVPVGNHRQRWALNESAFARIGAYAGIIKVVDKGGPAESATTAAPEPTFEEEQVAP